MAGYSSATKAAVIAFWTEEKLRWVYEQKDWPEGWAIVEYLAARAVPATMRNNDTLRYRLLRLRIL
jgi:hypothetical protein